MNHYEQITLCITLFKDSRKKIYIIGNIRYSILILILIVVSVKKKTIKLKIYNIPLLTILILVKESLI